MSWDHIRHQASDVLYVSISAASSGNNTLIAAAAGFKYRVLSYNLVAAGAVTAQFQSGAGGTNLTGAMSLITGTQVDMDHSEVGLFETASGALLNLVLGGAVQVSGHMTVAKLIA